jgi:ubiquinone biosynthesis protein UbiJ
VLTQSIENLLNQNLAVSPGARARCATLRGTLLRVRVAGTPLQWSVESLGDSLRLTRGPPEALGAGDTDATAEVEGSLLNLLALSGPRPEALLQRGAVRVSGDAELLQRYQELLRLLGPDVEEALSRVVGDSAAHQGLRLARGALGFGRRAATTAVNNLAEYLAHERGDLVPRGEADAFFADVDRLREDADRLAARLAMLEARGAVEPAP